MKKRNWVTIVYPDSVKDNWIDELQQTGLEVAISPLHDKDINPTGEIKKPHFHVIICFPGPTTFKCVQELSDTLLSGVLVKPIESIRGMYRYLTHLDNPEKVQYNKNDIILLNGFDPENVLSNSDESMLAQVVIEYINSNKIRYYHDLINSLKADGLTEELHVAMSKIMLFTSYLNSIRFKRTDGLKYGDNVIVDTSTGEILN